MIRCATETASLFDKVTQYRTTNLLYVAKNNIPVRADDSYSRVVFLNNLNELNIRLNLTFHILYSHLILNP